jgi:sporulation protein YhbH
MSIVTHDDWDLSEKGQKDAERHHEKIDDAIRKNVKGVIAEESIITKKRGRKVRVPVRGLKDYRFIHGQNEKGGGAGVGQGEGEPGDVIDSKDKQQGQGDQAGQEKGIDFMEAEVDIDVLLQIIFEDLGLPWIDERTEKRQIVPKGWKFETISKKGTMPRVHKKRTMMEAFKRQVAYIGEIRRACECDKEVAKRALRQSRGDINEAIRLINNDEVTETETSVKIHDEDLRYKQIERDVIELSKCVMVCMMDVSGSMTTDKKFLARTTLFWMVEFLRKCYDEVDVKFIVHTTEARLVDEETFFHKGESGGTSCHTAFDKANYLIDTEYPLNEWNVYVTYFSDGEDWNPATTVSSINEMLEKKINMLAYIELKPANNAFGGHFSNTLLKQITDKWKFKKTTKDGVDFYKNEDLHFMINIMQSSDHVWPVLKWILFDKKSKAKKNV